MATLITQPKGTDWSATEMGWTGEIKRIFYVYSVPYGVVRGLHRHKSCRMGLVCLCGSVEVYIQTPERDLRFRLDSPTQTLLLEPSDWRVMHNFSKDAILVAFADQFFVDTKYIDTSYRYCQYDTSWKTQSL
jgi:hypothetical protein